MSDTTTVQSLTVTDLCTRYAGPIAAAVGLDATEYESTAEGLADLLADTAEGFSPVDQTRDWVEDAAADLDALARLGDDDEKTRRLLKRVNDALYDICSELA